MSNPEPRLPEWRPALEALGEGARFLTRLPMPFLPAAPRGDVARLAWTFPIIGGLVGLAGGIAYAAGIGLGFTPFTAAALAVTASVALTGALHEDGLADTTDGFGGGRTITGKLDIMRDSRVGTYGAMALILATVLRIGAIASLADLGPGRVLLVLVAGEAVARAAMVRVWQELPSARRDGLSAASGSPDDNVSYLALAIALGLVAVAALPAAGLWAAVWGCVAAAAATLAFGRLCGQQIGGQTGDTLGATVQIALVAFLLLVAAFA